MICVQLGRIGDILNIMPACKLIGCDTIMVSPKFTFVLRGQSYLSGITWRGDMEDLRAAYAHARMLDGDVRVPQLFGRFQPDGMPARTRPSFVADQWDRLQPGLGDRWGMLPLEFDQRDQMRELLLIERLGLPMGKPKPLLLINTLSNSSPVDPEYATAIHQHLVDKWSQFEIVPLGRARAEAYCDLLLMYENAAGLITADTATLHLCQACPKLPVFQFTRPDRDCSPVRDRSQPYSERGFEKIDAFIESLKGAGR